MKKIVLIDGNNLMFRSYYATAYTGNVMKNSKGFPTNALYGFAGMMNKIIAEEKPSYIAVAFDIGKNFRKQEFSFYKEGRQTTPDELKMQMPIARDLLDKMGIKHFELEPYEADDIIGTFVKMVEEDKDFDATIISSDKDLLQLINYETDYKLLKPSGYIRYTEKSYEEEFGIPPIRVIDLKALMGDTSDNIPGVKGIGEKTALKLLNEYKTLDGIYENIDKIKGSTHDKLVQDKENAYMSYKIATIYKDVPLTVNLEDLKYAGPEVSSLKELYEELEFHSFIKSLGNEVKQEEIKYITVNDNINVVLENKVALYIEVDNEVYNNASVIGASICDSKYNYYFNKDNFNKLNDALKNKEIITYDHKKNLYFIDNISCTDDIMIKTYLLGLNTKEDISSLGVIYNENIKDLKTILKEDLNPEDIVRKSKLLYKVNDELTKSITDNGLDYVYKEIELPLINVLYNMEKEGIKVDKDILLNQGKQIEDRINELTSLIYKEAGKEFNISSPKQLGDILFVDLALAKGKKNKTGYKTDQDTLEKLLGVHPIIEYILEYRALTKLKSTYIEGLQNCIGTDSKIHTIFKQTIARTGRLSSTEPNLQNIPAHDELGRMVRKAFLPVNDIFISLDYSQIELRIFAHVSNCQRMIDTFTSDGDIHTQVASDINGVDIKDVTKEMRSKAKAVIFGIIYGISGFGLGDNLHISSYEAQEFINKYYKTYPEVKEFMDKEVSKVKETGYVTTMFGRKRVIDEIKNANYMIRQQGERMAINTPIQGTAADIIKLAMIRVFEAFKKENIQSKLILQVHDELIFDVKNEELDKVISIVKNIMENVVELKVPLKVSSDTGTDWYETK